MAPVDPQSTDSLFKAIDQAINQKVERINLLISSPGGSVFHGLSIYNFLKGAPIEVNTYNFGSVDSIGVVIFCSGSKRYSVPHARFLIHGVKFNISGNGSFDEKQMEEFIKGLKIDQQNIAKVISDTTQKPTHIVESDMNNRTTLNPNEAKDYGLIHEIKSELFPKDAPMIVIGENHGTNQLNQIPQGFPFPIPNGFPLPIQIQPQLQNPTNKSFSEPLINGFTQSDELNYSTI
jgi:ATP-dependent Clp endopeptidase proteolytic subunit ClpP